MTVESGQRLRDGWLGCGSNKRGSAGTCELAAGWGTDHLGIGACRLHAGASPNGRRAAANRFIEIGVAVLLEREGLQPLDCPLHQLQMLAAEVLYTKVEVGDLVHAGLVVRILGQHLIEALSGRLVVPRFNAASPALTS
jgi:hypothetical protein